ncbi:MAG: hypothetical protein NE328_01040 [Lentisphaeraceae bacterium]|nr:hypothetical protein [Lentisphaeraceae bacterium]
MKTFRIFPLLVISTSLIFLYGCKEAVKNVDEMSKEVTGQNKIEKKLEVEKKIKNITDKVNKNQDEALKKLDE